MGLRGSWADLSVGWWALILFAALGLQFGSLMPGSPLAPLETFGFVTGAIAVLLVVKDHPANWPIGIVNSTVYAVVFWRTRLFGDSILSMVYVALGLLGWWSWRFGKRGAPLPMGRGGAGWLVAGSAAGAAMTAFFYPRLVAANDSAPFLDALTTAYSLVAQALLTRRLVESWLYWIAVDAIYIPLYLWKGLPLTAVLYAVFLGLAVWGLVAWRRDLAGGFGPALVHPGGER